MSFYFQILKILPNYNQLSLTHKEERAAGVGDVVSK